MLRPETRIAIWLKRDSIYTGAKQGWKASEGETVGDFRWF